MDLHIPVPGPATKACIAIAANAGSAATAVLTVVGLLVTVGLGVIGWIITSKRHTADVNNSDLNALIAQLQAADISSRRVQGLPRPANSDDLQEIARLIPYLESHGAQFTAPLSTLVSDVVQDMNNLIGLPVVNSIPMREYGVRVQQQTRAVDKLLASIDKALTGARQMRR